MQLAQGLVRLQDALHCSLSILGNNQRHGKQLLPSPGYFCANHRNPYLSVVELFAGQKDGVEQGVAPSQTSKGAL